MLRTFVELNKKYFKFLFLISEIELKKNNNFLVIKLMSLCKKALIKFHNLRMRNQIFLIELFACLISFILIASFYRI